MTTLHYVKSARKNKPKLGIRKGRPYYWWSFGPRFGKQYSIMRPPRSAYLTMSPFIRALLDLEDRCNVIDTSDPESARSELESVRDELQGLQESTREAADNVSQRFPNGCPSLELLESRVEACESICDALQHAIDSIAEDSSEDDICGEISNIDWSSE